MNRLSALTIRYMIKNRRRTVTTIVGVLLATIIIFLFSEVVYSIKYSLNVYDRLMYGGWDIRFDIKAEKALSIRKDYEEKHELAGIGVERLWISTDTYYMDILQVNDFTEMEVPVRLTSGRLPENDHEVVWNGPNSNSSEVHEGDVVECFHYVSRELFKEDELAVLKEQEKERRIRDLKKGLVPEDSSYYRETIEGFDERWDQKEQIPVWEQFLVVGIAELDFQYWDTYTGLLTDEQLRDEPAGMVSVKLSVGSMSGLKEKAEAIAAEYDIDPGAWTVTYDDTLPPDYGDIAADALLLLIAAIFSIALMFVIRNGFNISVDERLKDYGLLRCIGLTRRQIFRMIRLEACIVVMIGVILGCLTGYVISVIVLPLHCWDILLGAFFGRGFRISVIFSVKGLLITAGMVFLTSLLAMVSPVEKLLRMSPIDAGVRREEIKSHRKGNLIDIRKPGIAVPYGIMSAKRTGGRFVRTVVSFSLGLALVVGLGTIIKTVSRTELEEVYQCDTGGSVSVGLFGPLKEAYVDIMDKWYAAEKEMKESDSCKKVDGLLLYTEAEEEDGVFKTTLAVAGITSGIWDKLEPDIQSEEIEPDQDEIPVLRIITGEYPDTGYQLRDSFTVHHSDKKLRVVGSIQESVFRRYTEVTGGGALPGSQTKQGRYIYPVDTWQPFRPFERQNLGKDNDRQWENEYYRYDSGMYGCLVIESVSGEEEKNAETMRKYLDYVDGIYAEDNPAEVIRIAGLCIAAVLGMLLLIMLINMINVERSLVNVRRDEFRILRVIGMSEKQRSRILISENMTASVIAVIIGTALGLILAAIAVSFIYRGNGLTGAFNPEYMKVRYTPDWIMIIISVGAVLAAGWLVAFLNRKDEAFGGSGVWTF